MYDYLIVGAGFAGSVLAERLASQADKRVLLVDRRDHIGGNAFDFRDEADILVHKYGPHIFHTNSTAVFEYLSRFTDWYPYEHRVLASVGGQLVPFPINRVTINRLFRLSLSEEEVAEFFDSRRVAIDEIATAEDVVLSSVGHELYEKFFRGYTRKQWGRDPSELDAEVTARIPVRTSTDDRYFTDKYQCMPSAGYTQMFRRMLQHPLIAVQLGCDFRDLGSAVEYRELIYTGCIDEFFGYEYGQLPYRSMDFKFERHRSRSFQPVAVVNYPNEHSYTRTTEFKHFYGGRQLETTIAYEYPKQYVRAGSAQAPETATEPYYPIPSAESTKLLRRYSHLAGELPHVHFVGRLGRYRYFNMDQVVGQALALAERLLRAGELRRQASRGLAPQRLVLANT